MFDKSPTVIEMGFILAGIVLVMILPFYLYGFIRLGFFRDAGSVNSRAPGSSEHASSFRRTEARAKRTIERPRTNKPALMSVGQLLRPALLSPRRQEWDDKGKALGVNRLQRTNRFT